MNLRLDRMATVYLVAPCVRLLRSQDRSIPILMYHCIMDQDESRVHPYYRTATSPSVFAMQLKYLQANGYKSCSLSYAINYLQNGSSTVEKLVVITFDDGYTDFHRHAFPVLKHYDFSAIVFLPTSYIGERPIAFRGKQCLTWREVRELKQNGILFGSHTVTHPQLCGLPIHAVREEVNNSKRTIEEKLGIAVDSFAYPFAFPQADSDFKRMLTDLLREAGYHNGVCTVVGRASTHSEPLFLQRLPVNSCDDNALLGAKLAGAYDWISTTQHISKVVKARVRHLRIPRKHSMSKRLPEVQQP